MLKKRVIFTLLFDRGNFTLSRNFRLQKVGDLRWLKRNYNFSQIAFSIDELIVLDVSREERNEQAFCEHVKSLTEECFVPIAAGGGVQSVGQARRLLQSGADKVVVNSAIRHMPEVVREIAAEFGQQCVVAAVDVKTTGDGLEIWTDNGTQRHRVDLREYVSQIVGLPVGEIYLNSVDRDGTGQGYLMELLEWMPIPMPVPVIMAGGAGNHEHLASGLKHTMIDAVATAHLFNFVGDGLEEARKRITTDDQVVLATWDIDTARSLKNSIG